MRRKIYENVKKELLFEQSKSGKDVPFMGFEEKK